MSVVLSILGAQGEHAQKRGLLEISSRAVMCKTIRYVSKSQSIRILTSNKEEFKGNFLFKEKPV